MSQLVFCSHCGFAQNLDTTAAPFVVQCVKCGGVTLGLGQGWESCAERSNGEIAPDMIQMEYFCPECQSGICVEILQNVAPVSCTRCSQMNAFCISESSVSMPSTKLTIEELAFLGQTQT